MKSIPVRTSRFQESASPSADHAFRFRGRMAGSRTGLAHLTRRIRRFPLATAPPAVPAGCSQWWWAREDPGSTQHGSTAAWQTTQHVACNIDTYARPRSAISARHEVGSGTGVCRRGRAVSVASHIILCAHVAGGQGRLHDLCTPIPQVVVDTFRGQPRGSCHGRISDHVRHLRPPSTSARRSGRARVAESDSPVAPGG
jgi:hypothetical protein